MVQDRYVVIILLHYYIRLMAFFPWQPG